MEILWWVGIGVALVVILGVIFSYTLHTSGGGLAYRGRTPRVEFPPSSDPKVPGPPSELKVDPNVQFTVYRPSTIVPEKWYTLLAFAHLSKRRPDAPKDEPDPIKEVKRQAARILSDQPAEYESAKLDRGFSVPRKGFLTFVPMIEGCEFNPSNQSIYWQKTVHKVEFEMMAPASLDGREVEGQMTVYLGNIILTEVPLRINIDSQYVAPSSQPDRFEEASAEPYRKIFASYSHKDTQVVEDFENYVQALGDQYLRDVKTLRSGEVWSKRLEEMISEANVFQLFWSSNSMVSKFVRQEWEFALGLERSGFIRPVYWEEPLPAAKPDLPPETLRRLHFYQFPMHKEETKSGVIPPAPPPEAVARGSRESETVPERTLSPEATQYPYPAPPVPQGIPRAPRKGQPKFAVLIMTSLLVISVAYIGLKFAPIFPPAMNTNANTTNTNIAVPSPLPSATPISTPSPTSTAPRTPTPVVPVGVSAVSVAVDTTSRPKTRGDLGSYSLVVKNVSSGPIREVGISERLPARYLEHVTSTPAPVRQDGPQFVLWQVPEILPGRSATIKVTVRLRRDLKPGEAVKTEQTVSYTDQQGGRHRFESSMVPITSQ